VSRAGRAGAPGRTALGAAAALLALTLTRPAKADEGDGPDVEGRRAPAVRARVLVAVTSATGEPLPSSVRATLQVSLERALGRDRRLAVIDADLELARRADLVPVEKVSEARGLLRAGEALLRRGQIGPAKARLEAASAHLAEVLAWTSKQELAEAQFLLAAARAIDGDRQLALADLVALLAWRPDHVADPTIEPGVVMRLWERAQRRAARLDGGSIEIASTPDGAMAYVDGRFAGFTPTVVEALPAATHYVTVRLHGRLRSVTAVTVSDRRPTRTRVELTPTPGADQLAAAVAAIAPAAGTARPPAAVQAAYGDLAELFEVDHVVVLLAPPGGAGVYRAAVHAVAGGALLARAQVELGERDPAEAFGALATALYRQIRFDPVAPPEMVAGPAAGDGQPGRRRWWLWTSVGVAVAAGIAVPLLVGRDRGPEVGCPPGDACGVVILRY
jgi:hypothetical protein